MKKILSLACISVLAVCNAVGQSAYFQALTNLNPVVYYPLQDSVPAVPNDVETNLGSIGPAGNAVYESTLPATAGATLTYHYAGPTSDGASVLDGDGAGGFLAVPNTVEVTNPVFTVEIWVNSSEQHREEGILTKTGNSTGGGVGNSNNQAGWCLSQDYLPYVDSGTFQGWDFHVYNGVGHEGAEVFLPYNMISGTWYHLVGTFDGQNCRIYVNGQDMVAAGLAIQIPMPSGTSYIPDTWNDIQIGSMHNLNGANYHGAFAEAAVYPAVLSSSRIQAHYNAAQTGTYTNAVLADNPDLYWRMNSPGYTPPTNPPAACYGAYTNSFQAYYGAAATPDISGPQFPGMLDPNNGNSSYGVQINGLGGNNGGQYTTVVATNPITSANFEVADASPINVEWADPNAVYAGTVNPIINPTGGVPFSVTCWFRSNPTDLTRFQTMFGHTDDGWRCAMNTGVGLVQFNAGTANGDLASDFGYNDGKWHQMVGTYDGYSNETLYVDGRLANSATNRFFNTTHSTNMDFFIGGDPQYVNCGNAFTIPFGTAGPIGGGYANRFFSGAVAHFAFFTNVLTTSQVESLYDTAVSNQPAYAIGQPVTGRTAGSGGTNGVGTGSYIFFAFVAGGAQPISYQWYYNSVSNYNGTAIVSDGVKYTNSTSIQLTVSNVMAGDSGYYYCIATNNYGSVTSILATLNVNFAPVIASQNPSAPFTLYQNQQAYLSVTASSPIPLSYQWYTNGTSDASGTSATYLTAPQTNAGNAFYCVVSNAYGTATSVTVSVSAILSLPTALTSSPFSSNVLTLNPTAYWPMHETGETPVMSYVETNYGSLGSIANGVYGDWKNQVLITNTVNIDGNGLAPININTIHGLPGAIAADSDPCVNFLGQGSFNNGFIVVPRVLATGSNNIGATTLTPPFTLEGWVRPDYNSFGIILGEHAGGLNGGNAGGFDWLYSGTSNSFSMTVYNGNGGGNSEPKTSASYPPGQWYHVVTTYDGTNVQYYIDGVADPMTGVNGTNGTYATMAPNTWDNITIACGRGYGNLFNGSIDELAVYTNLLQPSDILKHYQDGTNAAANNYMSDVLADKPLLYYRMDAPAGVVPPLNTWPVLTNYGAIAVNGHYTPASLPGGGPGPSEQGGSIAGLPANTALASDGDSTFADAGNDLALHPTGKTPFTVAAWMKGWPGDDGGRNWQSIAAQSDSGWRLNMDGGNGRANFNNDGGSGDTGNSTTSGASVTINDGQWHYVVGAFDGTNTIVYVDGLVSTTNINTAINMPNHNIDTFLGGYPQNNNTGWYSNTETAVANEINRVLDGSMCEAAYWSGVALKPAQVAAIYGSCQIPPVVDRQPIPANINQDVGFTNTTIFSGSAPITYQWYQNGVARAGQTNASLQLPSVQPTDSATNNGWYIIANNAYGSATSAVVTLTVNSVPTITQNIAVTNAIVFAGSELEYSIAADGAIPLHYQWYSNNVAVAGLTGTAANFIAQPPNATNIYYCIVTNQSGSATSYVATVTILPVSTAPYTATVIGDHPFGFWRLNDTNLDGLDNGGGDDGYICHDYANGYNGIYTNTVLGNPPADPLDTNASSAEFNVAPSGDLSDNDVFGIPAGVNFSAGSGTNSNFTIEAWVRGGSPAAQSFDAGLVSKGYSGSEQWDMDCGSDTTNAANPNPHSYRFFVRNAAGTTSAITSTVNPIDQQWHYLVGICNETNGTVSFYIDSLLIGKASITTNSGILATTRSMLIGSRPSSSTVTVNDDQFYGFMQDVAVYNYALSGQQVTNHYYAMQVPAHIQTQPTNTIASQGGSATFSVLALGTPSIGYQWWDVNANAPIVGATTATVTLGNLTANDSFYCVVTNAYGTNQSQSASVTVISGAPQVYEDLSTNGYFVEVGNSITIPFTVYGTVPLAYQWYFNGAPMANSARITGTQTNALTINFAQLSDAGNYQVVVTNNSGSVTSSIAPLVVGSVPIDFLANGLGWTTNQAGGPYSMAELTGTNSIVLTDGAGNEDRSYFFNYPQYVQAFQASFTYVIGGNRAADGISFCLQNDPRGASALGGGGGSLGVSGITPSWELEFNIYTGNSESCGYNIFTNGINGAMFQMGPINMTNGDNGDPINVSLYYASGNMSITFTDAVIQGSFSTNFPCDIPTAVGGTNTAFVGFTGADGGANAIQVVTNFTFISLPTAQMTLSPPNANIAWPNSIPGYTLQSATNLSSPVWINVNAPLAVTNNTYLYTVPLSNKTVFYRLTAP
ncbi:MAG TPA: LamG-like jellyroll fold domain-containing protein [Verrucomicrobiae bacterium]|nr:LamG-like jellyroll fold domain-containing protein [Verrucomicrobiae bacterium]